MILSQIRGKPRFEAALALASEQGLARWLPISMYERGWTLAAQGQHESVK
jgi:hypothetical protein